MIIRSVWNDIKEPLELHEDARGRIVDVFYGEHINHVAIITSKGGAVRGNHYHKRSVQHMLMTKGAMEYWYKRVDSGDEACCVIVRVGDVVTTPPLEIHALRFVEQENEFFAFATGLRGGKDYESDTFRVSPSIIHEGDVG